MFNKYTEGFCYWKPTDGLREEWEFLCKNPPSKESCERWKKLLEEDEEKIRDYKRNS